MPQSIASWLHTNRLVSPRRWPLALAFLSLAAYIAALVLGSALQASLNLRWSMGWFQQAGSALVSILIALAIGEPRSLLALRSPAGRWLVSSVAVGLSITAVGYVVSQVLPPSPAPLKWEYIVYEATAPGIAEELGMRGLWLSLLVVWAGRVKSLELPGALVLFLAAVPFTLLHLLEHKGLDLIVISVFTLYAGFVLGWLRLTFASIWPAMIAHNIANVASATLDYVSRQT